MVEFHFNVAKNLCINAYFGGSVAQATVAGIVWVVGAWLGTVLGLFPVVLVHVAFGGSHGRLLLF